MVRPQRSNRFSILVIFAFILAIITSHHTAQAQTQDTTTDDAGGEATPTNVTTPTTPSTSSGPTITIPDVSLCDCGFVDAFDPLAHLFTSYYQADFHNMTAETLNRGLRALTYTIARDTSGYSRSIRPEQVALGSQGVELKVSPLSPLTDAGSSTSSDGSGTNNTSNMVVPSAALSSVNSDFWFGSYHMRGKVSNQTGTVAALYTYFNDTQEVDVEYVAQNNRQHLRYTTKPQHYESDGRPAPETYASQTFPSPNGESISDDFRYWSFRWMPESVTYALDLNYTRSLVSEVPQVPSYLLVSHWSDGNPHFSAGPPTSDSLFVVSDIAALYNSSQATLPLACKTLTRPCTVNVRAKTVTVPASTPGATTLAQQHPPQAYVGNLVVVNGEAIDSGHGKGGLQEKWKVIVVCTCGAILGITVIACLWNCDGFITKCCGRKRADVIHKRFSGTFSQLGSIRRDPGGGGGGGGGVDGIHPHSDKIGIDDGSNDDNNNSSSLAMTPALRQQYQPVGVPYERSVGHGSNASSVEKGGRLESGANRIRIDTNHTYDGDDDGESDSHHAQPLSMPRGRGPRPPTQILDHIKQHAAVSAGRGATAGLQTRPSQERIRLASPSSTEQMRSREQQQYHQHQQPAPRPLQGILKNVSPQHPPGSPEDWQQSRHHQQQQPMGTGMTMTAGNSRGAYATSPTSASSASMSYPGSPHAQSPSHSHEGAPYHQQMQQGQRRPQQQQPQQQQHHHQQQQRGMLLSPPGSPEKNAFPVSGGFNAVPDQQQQQQQRHFQQDPYGQQQQPQPQYRRSPNGGVSPSRYPPGGQHPPHPSPLRNGHRAGEDIPGGSPTSPSSVQQRRQPGYEQQQQQQRYQHDSRAHHGRGGDVADPRSVGAAM